MELQRQILLFFLEKATPLFDSLAQFFTLFGEPVVAVAVCLFIFLCIDKRKGFALVFSFLSANVTMNVAKLIIRFPRPWVVYPEIKCKKMSTATGYSFPSGHTTCSSVMFGSASVLFRKRVLSVISAIIILFVGISRSYLCCHWPLDVVCGWFLGLGFAFFITPLMLKLFDNFKANSKWMKIAGFVFASAGLVVAMLIDYAGADKTLYKDLTEGLALLGMGMVAFTFEEKHLHFAICKKWSKRIAGYVVAMLGAVFFVVVMKKFVPSTGFWAWARYSLVVVWTCMIYPWLGMKLGFLDAEA